MALGHPCTNVATTMVEAQGCPRMTAKSDPSGHYLRFYPEGNQAPQGQSVFLRTGGSNLGW